MPGIDLSRPRKSLSGTLDIHWQVRIVIRPLLVFGEFDVSHGFGEALMLVGRLFTAADKSCRYASAARASSLVPIWRPSGPGWPGINLSQSMAITFLRPSSISGR